MQFIIIQSAKEKKNCNQYGRIFNKKTSFCYEGHPKLYTAWFQTVTKKSYYKKRKNHQNKLNFQV